MKIDLVYLWVDGSDIEWIKKRNRYLPEEDQRDEESFCQGRYQNNDELKYSLRSVEIYAPWINNIYIITDNQCPKWLNTNNSHIKIIHHSEIVPSENLPIFNSVAIEHCIVNIPGLSECFIYANDDMLLNRSISPNFFFTKRSKPISRFLKMSKSQTQKYKETKTVYNTTINKVNKVMYDGFGVDFSTLTPHHQIDAYSKSSIIQCLNKYNEWNKKTISNRFRSQNDMQRHIFSTYAVVTNASKAKFESPIVRKLHKLTAMLKLRAGVDSLLLDIHTNNLLSRIAKFRPALICFNDGPTATNEDREQLKLILEKKYPKKSKFEL